MADAFEGKFTRVSPAQFVEKIALPLGWFVVRFDQLPDKSARRRSHGKWFSIVSDKGTIYRMLRFSINLRGSSGAEEAQIVLDWAGWIDLHGRDEDVDMPLQLTISRVSGGRLPLVYLKHPDPAVRLSSYLGWTSISLGALSIILAIVIWCMSK